MALTIIDDNAVVRLLANKAFRAEFPFLATTAAPPPKGKKCTPCSRKRRRTTRSDYSRIRREIALMSNPMKAKFKKLLKAQQVQVDYTNGAGKKIRMRF